MISGNLMISVSGVYCIGGNRSYTNVIFTRGGCTSVISVIEGGELVNVGYIGCCASNGRWIRCVCFQNKTDCWLAQRKVST